MNLEEYLLTSLSEEANEIGLQIGKCLRFGLNDVYTTLHPDGTRTVHTEVPTNRYRLIGELNDLMGVVQEMVDQGILPRDWMKQDMIHKKREKITRYMQYAREGKTLIDNEHNP